MPPLPIAGTIASVVLTPQMNHQVQSSPGALMTNLRGLSAIVAELRVERTNLVSQLQHVDAALAVLGKLDDGSNYTEPRRRMSASARRRISLAQKARWAKRSAKTAGSAPTKRTMSASA